MKTKSIISVIIACILTLSTTMPVFASSNLVVDQELSKTGTIYETVSFTTSSSSKMDPKREFEVMQSEVPEFKEIEIAQDASESNYKMEVRYASVFTVSQNEARKYGYQNGNVKKCAVGKHPKSEKHGNTAQFSEVERSGTQENCGGIGSGCRLRLHPLPVLRRRQSHRVACIDPDAVVVDKNIAKNDRFDLFSR